MPDKVLQNQKEMIIPFHVFKALPEKNIVKSLLPAKVHKSRKLRRTLAGTVCCECGGTKHTCTCDSSCV